MPKRSFPMLACMFALLVGTPAAQAEPSATAEAPVAASPALDPAYDNLFAAMESGVDQHALLTRQVDAVIRAMKESDPVIARLSAKPGFNDRLRAVMMPFIERHAANLQPLLRRDVTALMARHLSPAEAGTWTAFYTSALGRKILLVAQQNATYSTTAKAALSDGEVSASVIDRDLSQTGRATGRALTGQMTLDEQRQMLVLMRRPSYAKFLTMVREVGAVRAPIENTPMEPALQAEGQAGVTAFLLAEQGVKEEPAPEPPTG